MGSPLIELPPKERQLLALLRERGRILPRIKERGNGDVESVQPPLVHGQAGTEPHRPLDEDEVLTCLHALEARGLVRSKATVCQASATEYICEWTVRSER